MKLSLPSPWFIAGSALLALVTAMLWLLPEPLANALMGEQGAIERGTAALFVVAAIGFGWVGYQTRGWLRAHALFWALLAIFCAGEETSWLQHEVGYATPAAIAEANAQGEFNLHNLRGLHGGKILEAETTSPALSLLGAQNLFQIGFLAYFLGLPAAVLLPRVRALVQRYRVPYLSWSAVLVVWLPIATAIALAFLSSGLTKSLLAETREFHYAVAFALMAVCAVGYVRVEGTSAVGPARVRTGGLARVRPHAGL